MDNDNDDDDDDVTVVAPSDHEYHASDASKRRWGKYSLQAWGKRRWSATNSGAAWGKRQAAAGQDLTPALNELDQGAEKRRWSANSGMRAWGKRSARRPYFHVGRSKRSIVGDFALSPRHWAPPVKRQWRYGGPKRKWEYNTMNSWGKRPAASWPDHVDRVWPKRSWSSDNSLRVWG